MTKANKTSFQKGKSGNPGGRPKRDDYIKDLARQHTEAAIERLVFWLKSEDARASVAACTALLDRGWGKPAQAIEHSGEEGGPLAIQMIQRTIVDPQHSDA